MPLPAIFDFSLKLPPICPLILICAFIYKPYSQHHAKKIIYLKINYLTFGTLKKCIFYCTQILFYYTFDTHKFKIKKNMDMLKTVGITVIAVVIALYIKGAIDSAMN